MYCEDNTDIPTTNITQPLRVSFKLMLHAIHMVWQWCVVLTIALRRMNAQRNNMKINM